MPDNNPDPGRIEICGFLEKIRSIFPAFKEYHKLRDINEADQILCKQVFNRLNDTKTRLEILRDTMSDKNDFSSMASIGSIIAQIRHLSDEISRTQQEITHISSNARIEEKTLKNLYEYDYSFLSGIEQIFLSVSLTDYISGIYTARTIANKIFPMVEDFWHVWEQRSEYVERLTNTTDQL